MNGLTYFRLKSTYEGDITKNCALNGNEVDGNFYTLEGRDISAVVVEGDDLIIRLVNGTELRAKDIKSNDFVTNVDFDQSRGVLRITKNGETTEIGGFNTQSNSGATVAVDGTLVGNGTPVNPVGISPIAKSGQLKPVDEILEIGEDGSLPRPDEVRPGYRVLTHEVVSDYGFLYDYEAVKRIACELRNRHSEWRIPTKEDWDDMLDAVEPAASDKTHTSAANNRYLGKWAGKLLKSVDKWKEEEPFDVEGEHNHCHEHHHHHCDINDTCIDYGEDTMNCGHHEDVCRPIHCGIHGHGHHHHHHSHDNNGLDEYGFNITPAGYADDGENFMYFKERAYFWTASNSNFTSAYAKRFEFDKSCVHQDIMAAQNHLSLRLVKTFKGENFCEREEILGNSYNTVLMPSMKYGHAVWTSINFACNARQLNAVVPNDGQNLTMSDIYFVNEWDGKRWFRTQLAEGETIVVKKTPDGKVDEEYIIKGGALMSVAESIREDVSTSVKDELDELHNHIRTKIVELKQYINDSLGQTGGLVSQDIEAINNHLTQIDETVENFRSEYDAFVMSTNEATEALNTALSAETEAREADVEKLNNDLSNAVEEINNKVDEVKDSIEELQNNSASSAEALQALGDELHTAIDDAKTELQCNIDTVTENLEALGAHVDELEEGFTADIEAANTKINQETENRIAKDEEIEASVEDVKGDIIVQEGTVFDAENGKITLKSSDGSNDVVIQLRANFGGF